MAIKRNVQQQNAVTREEIANCARVFRDPFNYPWLHVALVDRGLDPWTGILAKLRATPEQNGEYFEGVWLASGPQFFRFTALVVSHPAISAEIETWQNVTDETEVNEHCPGVGKSFGWLATEVLRDIQNQG